MKQIVTDAISAFRTGKGLKGQLLRGGVGSVAVKIGSTLLNVLLAIVLARALGVEGFGVYSFVFALITIMAIPAQMGLPNLVVRETAKAQATGDWALMKGLWRWSTLMALMMSIGLMAIGALAAWAFAARLPEGGLTVFYWGLVLVPLVALGNLRGAALRGLRHVVQGQLPEFILRPAFLIVLVLGAHFGLSARALTASDAMMLHALASLVAFMIGAWMLLRARPQELNAEPNATAHSSLWLKSALPLGIVQAVQLLNQNIGFVVLGIFASSIEVALLRIAWQGALFAALGLAVVEMIVAPHFARFYALNDLQKIRRLLAFSSRLSLLVALPIMVTYALFGSELLSMFFGEEFREAYLAMLILAAGRVTAAIAGPVNTLLIMAGKERDASMIAVSTAALNCVLAVPLALWAGLEGVAIGSAFSTVIWNGLVLNQIRRTKILQRIL